MLNSYVTVIYQYGENNIVPYILQVKIGLWIDLTNTQRFYDRNDVEREGARYLKLKCRGHGEAPTTEQVNTFVSICEKFIRQNPLEIVGELANAE